MTKPKPTKVSEKHSKILGGIESYGFTYGEAWARPGEASKPYSFSTWRCLGEAGRGHHVTRIDCAPESEADRGLGIIKLLNESHGASPAHPLKNFLARILGRNFSHFFLLAAAWVKSRADRPSVSYTRVTRQNRKDRP